ncbi:hypothetical protein [Chthoniobacter sp.]|uniref:hypothetical protein n=1 Tax=Chthoniobacter sp. TaxID=2510640 RepID=UPI0032AEBE1E
MHNTVCEIRYDALIAGRVNFDLPAVLLGKNPYSISTGRFSVRGETRNQNVLINAAQRTSSKALTEKGRKFFICLEKAHLHPIRSSHSSRMQ